ncbi:hypothetical protein Tco_0438731 [Tanacetum coccineum]
MPRTHIPLRPNLGVLQIGIKSQDLVMSDSEESGITHTTVSSLYEDLSDIGSPRADDHELLEPPYMLEDPYAEAAFQAPPSPDYVLLAEFDQRDQSARERGYSSSEEQVSPSLSGPEPSFEKSSSTCYEAPLGGQLMRESMSAV